jgi:hypothetical protein
MTDEATKALEGLAELLLNRLPPRRRLLVIAAVLAALEAACDGDLDKQRAPTLRLVQGPGA